MKVTREQADANRQRVVEESSRLFRERGFADVGLNELMQAAGLTRGGFYGQFESKQDLVREALASALQHKREQWNAFWERSDVDPLALFIERYLSDAHHDNRAGGCALAALAGDVGRQDEATRDVFEDGVRRLLNRLAPMLPGPSAEEQQQQAMACLSSLVGALLLSRAVADETLSAGLRSATAQALEQAYVTPPADQAGR